MYKTLTALLIYFLAAHTHATGSVGTVAIYTDGQVEKLIEVGEGWTLWEDARKRRYKRSYLPFLPQLSYQRFPVDAGVDVQTVVAGEPESLKPYGDQKSVSFDIFRDKTSGGSKRYWKCEYQGIGQFRLVKQELSTHNYYCERGIYTSRFYQVGKEIHEISFSPELNVVVEKKRIDKNGKKKRTKLYRLYKPDEVDPKRISKAVYRLRKNR